MATGMVMARNTWLEDGGATRSPRRCNRRSALRNTVVIAKDRIFPIPGTSCFLMNAYVTWWSNTAETAGTMYGMLLESVQHFVQVGKRMYKEREKDRQLCVWVLRFSLNQYPKILFILVPHPCLNGTSSVILNQRVLAFDYV